MRTAIVLLTMVNAACNSTHHVTMDHDVTVTHEPAPTIESFFTPVPVEVRATQPPPFWPPHEHVAPTQDPGTLPWSPTIN